MGWSQLKLVQDFFHQQYLHWWWKHLHSSVDVCWLGCKASFSSCWPRHGEERLKLNPSCKSGVNLVPSAESSWVAECFCNLWYHWNHRGPSSDRNDWFSHVFKGSPKITGHTPPKLKSYQNPIGKGACLPTTLFSGVNSLFPKLQGLQPDGFG